MSSLYELSANLRALAEKLEETDLPPEVIFDTLDGESLEFEEKVISVAKFKKNLEASAKARREAAALMLDRAKSEERRADYLTDYLMNCLELAKRQKVESPWFNVTIRNNPPRTVIDDESVLPSDYIKEVPASYSPDLNMIKQAIKDGFEVPGAHLESTKSIQIK